MNYLDFIEKVLTIHQKIASDVFPAGGELRCEVCKFTQVVSSDDCVLYLSKGWPKHCGQTMTFEKLRAELVKAMSDSIAEAEAKLEVKVGQGIVEVFSLDDSGVRAAMELEYRSCSKRYIKLIGTRTALSKIAEDCETRGRGWDSPPGYFLSMRAAAKRIRTALAN